MEDRSGTGRLGNVCVYCGSSSGGDPIYVEAARTLGRAMAAKGVGLVYGGGGRGLMGALAREVVDAGAILQCRNVFGVAPSSEGR